MKDIYEILKGIGLEIDEDHKAEFDKAWKENYRTKAEYDKAVSQRDEYKGSLEDVQGKLEAFKDINVDDLQNQITELKNDLQKKDDEYAAKEANRLFLDSIKEAIGTAKGRSAKAIMAELDLDKLKESKNQKADIEEAIENCKKDYDYLFDSDEPIKNPVGPTGGAGGSSATDALRAAMGLPDSKKGE